MSCVLVLFLIFNQKTFNCCLNYIHDLFLLCNFFNVCILLRIYIPPLMSFARLFKAVYKK